jgi:HEPN domain-containing protein
MTARLDHTRRWLDRAAEDLRLAAHDLTAEPPGIEDACFHAQQAVEKLLKAYLTWNATEFDWTHRIAYLIELCATHDSRFASLHDSADALTFYAVRVRYPHPGPPPTLEEAHRAIEVARSAQTFVLSALRADPLWSD